MLFTFCVSVVALLGAPQFLRAKYNVQLLYVILVMGIQGMIMTRDLFNLFVFLEIVSIGTFGLLGLRDTSEALSAAFKFVLSTVIASIFFLFGTALIYYSSGLLNIDELIAARDTIAGPFGFAAIVFLLACLLVELKPFPANGWGLDVYETAPGRVAALISVGVSAGIFVAFLNLLPLFEGKLTLIAALCAVTFIASNLVGLSQTKAQRLLGYSSIGQMALMTMAAVLLYRTAAEATTLFVVGALFVNHLFAKAGLFWLAAYVGKERLDDWGALAGRPTAILVFAVLLAAISGFPPFPGFWAKWHLVLDLAANEGFGWIVAILIGSLPEVAYLFRWFGRVVISTDRTADPAPDRAALCAAGAAAILLACGGLAASVLAGLSALWVYLPLLAGLAVYLVDGWSGRAKGLLVLAIVLPADAWVIRDLSGIGYLFAVLLYAGGSVLSVACLYRNDVRPGFYPMLVITLLSLVALPRCTTSLEFFFIWELVSLSAYFLIVRERKAESAAFVYLLFSIASAKFLLAGFALSYAVSGSVSLDVLRMAGPESNLAFVLLGIACLIKVAALGVHIWLPAAHAEADYEVSALLSAVITKAAVFGLLVCTYISVRSNVTLELALVLGWIGMLTTLTGAILAVRQDDFKRMLAYSSMSQLGYIVTAIALMSHLGWVTALYLAANHMFVKGILFLVAATVIIRTGTRTLSELGGLARSMPQTFAIAAVALLAMSGLPPLMGFGGKWLLLSAMMEKGWYMPLMFGALATFVGFLYMARIVSAVFLGPQRKPGVELKEAPLAFLVPQYVLVAGILVMSFYPKLLIDPVSAAIDPYFASTLVWEGMSLEMIYGFWNPAPVMVTAVAVSILLFVVAWFVHRRRSRSQVVQEGRDDTMHRQWASAFYAFYRRFLEASLPPLVESFWGGVSRGALACAGQTRRIYTGNGQTYALYVLYYFAALYLMSGGLSRFWPAS